MSLKQLRPDGPIFYIIMQFWGKVVQIIGFVCPSWDPSLVVVSVIHTEFVKLIFLEKIKIILAILRMIQRSSLIFKFFSNNFDLRRSYFSKWLLQWSAVGIT